MENWKCDDRLGESIWLASRALEPTGLALTVTQQLAEEGDGVPDLILEATFQGYSSQYACWVSSASTPQAVLAAVLNAKFRAEGASPLILVPYLFEDSVPILVESGVSGIDLCGNAYVRSNNFLIWRTGQPRRFKAPAGKVNPFRGDKSIFARSLLLRSEFDSLTSLQQFASEKLLVPANGAGQKLQLGTASKTVQALEEQLIVQRTKGSLRLTDRSKLLAQLKLNYQSPVSRKVVGKIPIDPTLAWEKLAAATGLRVAATGISSASKYGVLSPSERLSIFVDDLVLARSVLDFTETTAFANCELLETKKNFPYFDVVREDGVVWSSAVQTWLELSNGNSREQEAAAELETRLGVPPL